ncbi:MAG: acyltransferase [Bacillota bacterium]
MSGVDGTPARPGRERIAELDVMRGLAFLAVVFQHSLAAYAPMQDIQAPDAVMMGMVLHFTKFAVPAFIFVTGMVLVHNYRHRLNYAGFIKKRTMDIFVPYALWTLIYDLGLNGMPSTDPSRPALFLKNLALGTEVYHLWFVIMIFQFYLAFPLLLALLKKLWDIMQTRLGAVAVVTGLTALYTLLMWFSYSYIPAGGFNPSWPAVKLTFIDYRDRNFLFFILYFIMGGLAGMKIAAWRGFIKDSAGWNAFLFTGLYIWVGYELVAGTPSGHINLNYSTLLKPSMFLFTASGLLLVYGLSMSITGKNPLLSKILDFTGAYSYGGYLAHAMVLSFLVNKTFLHQIPGHHLIRSVLTFALCAPISLALTFLLSKIPYGRLLIGPHRNIGRKNAANREKNGMGF